MSLRIYWQTENVMLPDLDFQRTGVWLDEVARVHGRLINELNYIFCDDERIIEVNRQFLSHDYYTDIITFDYCRGRMLRGDMYISLDTVRSNAEVLAVDYQTELLRVIVHGVLHLCGIDDKAPGAREIMERNENEALALYRAMTE